jgi:N-acetylneuraminate synthase/N,N'-diacetyllegionaminate synthase|tara:strand:- start:906 stop:1919 length:1014 start_codon:yes stop_codon:yes gene_type:complete
MKNWEGKHGVYLIAEIGGNHEGNFDKAQELTQLACASGVDAVKFQIYTADSLTTIVEDPERHAHYKRLELTPEQHIAIAEICKSNDVTYSASVWDLNALEWIDPYIQFYKIGSGDLTAFPIIEKIAHIGKPIIISTGLATLGDVKESLEFIKSVNNNYRDPNNLALLQCTSSYPTPDSDTNLLVMKTLMDEFDEVVGYSDHSVDSYAAEIAVAMGAEILELHFTDNKKNTSFRDHQVSFTTQGIQELVSQIKRIHALKGSTKKEPTKSEIHAGMIQSFRRGIYAARDLSKGEVLEYSDLVVLRPMINVDGRSFKKMVGRTLKKSVSKLKRIDFSLLN